MDQEEVKHGKAVKAGEILKAYEPWISVIHWEERDKICAFCWKKKEGLSACQKCRFCYYCNKGCQASDWRKEHKHECAMLAAALDALALQIITHTPGDGWTAAVHLLYVKALNRFAVDYGTGEVSTDEVREVFLNPINEYRKAIPLAPAYPLRPADFRQMVSRRMKYSLLQAVTNEQCEMLMRNIIIAKENITNGWREFLPDRSEVHIIGSGVYLEPLNFQSACRSNADWVFSGNRMVLKALVDMPNFYSAKQVTIAPEHFRDILTLRAERKEMQDYFDAVAQYAGRNLQRWNCDCLYCSDAFEAQMNPIKCVTRSCMERTPSDERALLPCSQCGATNGNRLPEARDQVREAMAKLMRYSLVKEKHGGIPNAVAQFFIGRSIFLNEQQDSKIVLHPDNMIRGAVAYQMMKNMMYSNQLPTAFQYATLCCEAVRRYYSDVDPFYGIFLTNYAKCALAYWKEQLEKDKRTTKALDANEMKDKLARYVDLKKQGDAIMKKFCAPE